MNNEKHLSTEGTQELLQILENRFAQNMSRHQHLAWSDIKSRIESQPAKLWSIGEMERTGGEPDVIESKSSQAMYFVDCTPESPKFRRSICYDEAALQSRKENKPAHSALGMANEMGIDILSEQQYRELQQYGTLDSKTSSWIKTPIEIRKLGGALFGDYRYGTVFIYHNGAESYYAARGFRGILPI